MYSVPTLYEYIISGIALAVCLYTDIKNGTVHPLVCLALVIAASFEPNKDFTVSLITAAIGFIPMFVAARLGNGGGGDALLLGALGYTMPFIFSLYMYLAASLYYVIVLTIMIIKTKDRNMHLPYVPFIFAGWLTLLAFYVTGVLG